MVDSLQIEFPLNQVKISVTNSKVKKREKLGPVHTMAKLREEKHLDQ